MNPDFLNALVGGLIIGFATVLLLHFNGRVTGISGIIANTLKFTKGDWAWRALFILGLFVGGVVMKNLYPEQFHNTTETSWPVAMIAGLFVGFGTIMGSGCTSGHGVCGISRLSVRSLVATVTFILAGAATVFFRQH